jgi:hypothetical protein
MPKKVTEHLSIVKFTIEKEFKKVLEKEIEPNRSVSSLLVYWLIGISK